MTDGQARPGRPAASSASAAARMRANGPRDTAPELALRRELHARGWRYRVDQAVVPGSRRRADVVFRRHRVAVYVDGCFWHSCPDHVTVAKNNAEFWRDKLAENVRRDQDTDGRLAALGWLVVRVWEHEEPRTAADRVEAALRSRQAPLA